MIFFCEEFRVEKGFQTYDWKKLKGEDGGGILMCRALLSLLAIPTLGSGDPVESVLARPLGRRLG